MRSLGSRLTWWYVLVVSITVVAALCVGRWLLERQLLHGLDLLNAAEFQEIVDRSGGKRQPLPEAEVLQQIAAHAKIDAALYFFQLRDARGNVVFRSDNMGDGVLPQNPPGQTNWTRDVPVMETVRVGEYPLGDMRLQIAATLGAADRLLHSYFQASLGMLGVSIALSIFFGHRLSRLALDPVRRIQLTAQRITAENLSERIPVDRGKDEIADLTRLLNKMFDRLEISFERLWRFAADASHELKTPLSLIKLQSEKLLFQDGLTSSQRDAVQQQLESISRLDAVIEKLLFLAKSEVGAITLNLRRQSAMALIKGVMEDALALCEDAGVEFKTGDLAELEVTCDATLLRQVILNLLANATNATPAAGQVILSSEINNRTWRVVVEDSGPGLPPERIKDVFEPFVRIAARDIRDNAGGSGLGLAICRSILDLHKGSIRAENRQPGPGLRVAFEIPLDDQVADKLAA
jgi:signal transduction histidine kinase